MNRLALHIALLAALSAAPAHAQQVPTPPGQIAGGMSQSIFDANTSAVGFGENNLGPSITASGTTQATATVLLARTSRIIACATGAGVILPSLTRYAPITVINRSGAACLVYPSLGATAESAPGTVAAANASVSVANNTTVTFRPVTAAAWLQ